MKVTAIETIRIDEFPNLLWLQEGAGLGLSLNADRLQQPDVHIRRSAS